MERILPSNLALLCAPYVYHAEHLPSMGVKKEEKMDKRANSDYKIMGSNLLLLVPDACASKPGLMCVKCNLSYPSNNNDGLNS